MKNFSLVNGSFALEIGMNTQQQWRGIEEDEESWKFMFTNQ